LVDVERGFGPPRLQYTSIETAIALVLPIKNGVFSHEHDVNRAFISSESGSLTPRHRRRRALQYLLVFVGCVLLVDALVGDKGLVEMMKKRQEYRALEQTLGRARAENATLREEARRLREDPAAIEDIARRELGLIKPGEKVFIVRDVDPARAPGDK
jgi:cell division protein FtsB